MERDAITMQKKAEKRIRKGTVITGKWHQNNYTIVRIIGSGTVGTVYLCRMNDKLVALKLSTSPMSLIREVTILKRFNKARDQHLGPFLFDVDDWDISGGEHFAFYAMEYIHGVRLENFIKHYGSKWIGDFMIQMLDKLDELHKMGLVYGDLKNDNLLVMNKGNPIVRFIDVGGVTKIGQSVKEYSNFYDRGYWQLGTRNANAEYDLFALVMVFLTVYYPKQFSRKNNSRQLILKHIQQIPSLRVFQYSFKKAIYGTYPSAKVMKQDIQMILKNAERKQQDVKGAHVAQICIILFVSIGYYLLSLVG